MMIMTDVCVSYYNDELNADRYNIQYSVYVQFQPEGP